MKKEPYSIIGNINSEKEMETFLNSSWTIPFDEADHLIQVLSANRYFCQKLLPPEWENLYIQKGKKILETILCIPCQSRNIAQITLLQIMYLQFEEYSSSKERQLCELKDIICFCRQTTSLQTTPLTVYEQMVRRQQTTMQQQKEAMQPPFRKHAILQKYVPDSTTIQESIIAFSMLLSEGQEINSRIEQTLLLIMSVDKLPDKDTFFRQAYKEFYQTRCWQSEPIYACAVQCILLYKLNQNNIPMFTTDLLSICQISSTENITEELAKYLEVLSAFCSDTFYSENSRAAALISQCTDKLRRMDNPYIK